MVAVVVAFSCHLCFKHWFCLYVIVLHCVYDLVLSGVIFPRARMKPIVVRMKLSRDEHIMICEFSFLANMRFVHEHTKRASEICARLQVSCHFIKTTR